MRENDRFMYPQRFDFISQNQAQYAHIHQSWSAIATTVTEYQS